VHSPFKVFLGTLTNNISSLASCKTRCFHIQGGNLCLERPSWHQCKYACYILPPESTKGYRQDPVVLLVNTTAEMFKQDDLRIRPHDWSNAATPFLIGADEIDIESDNFPEYFGNVTYNKAKTFVSAIIKIHTMHLLPCPMERNFGAPSAKAQYQAGPPRPGRPREALFVWEYWRGSIKR